MPLTFTKLSVWRLLPRNGKHLGCHILHCLIVALVSRERATMRRVACAEESSGEGEEMTEKVPGFAWHLYGTFMKF